MLLLLFFFPLLFLTFSHLPPSLTNFQESLLHDLFQLISYPWSAQKFQFFFTFSPSAVNFFHSLSVFSLSLQSQVFVTPFVLHRKFISGHILGASKIWSESPAGYDLRLQYLMWCITSLNQGEKTKIPKSLLPRHWGAGLCHPMSMLSPTVVGHEVLGKGAWWTAGITVLCCISPTGLGFAVQTSRSLFAQLETCCSQHDDSSIYNVLLPDMFGSFGEVPLRSYTRAWPCCQKCTIPSALWPASAETKD